MTTLNIRSSHLYFEDTEQRFFDVADFKKISLRNIVYYKNLN